MTLWHGWKQPIPSYRSAITRAVLVVDQFGEPFTLCPDESKRSPFLHRLLTLPEKQRVVITMRADFWGDCANYTALKETMLAHQELIAPMDSAELRRAMEGQARGVGLRFEADLSNTILDEVQGEPGAMPLLQHAPVGALEATSRQVAANQRISGQDWWRKASDRPHG